MRRWVFLLGLCWAAAGIAQEQSDYQEAPPGMIDEDEDLLPRTEYVFNPIQANRDLKVGKFYAKKGNHRAAAARFLEATKWNPRFGEAYWRLAESREKLDQPAQAMDAYRSYLEIEPKGKKSDEARERLAELESQQERLPLASGDSER